MATLSGSVVKTGYTAEYSIDCSGCVHMHYPCLYVKGRLHGVIVCLAWGWLGKSKRKRQMNRKVSPNDIHFVIFTDGNYSKRLSDNPTNAD